MHVNVLYKQKIYTLELDDNATVLNLKERLLNIVNCNVPIVNQKLICKGKILSNNMIMDKSMKKILLIEIKENSDINETRPCRNNCGFYGTCFNKWLCSKCNFESSKPLEPPVLSGDSDSSEIDNQHPIQENVEKCWKCNRNVGLLGFGCRCSYVFCRVHRIPEKHDCIFNWKQSWKDDLRKQLEFEKDTKIDKI